MVAEEIQPSEGTNHTQLTPRTLHKLLQSKRRVFRSREYAKSNSGNNCRVLTVR
jgi:hypothetical protein